MVDLFKELQQTKAQQEQVLEHAPPPIRPQKSEPVRVAQKVAQKPAHVSNPMSKGLSTTITQDAVEELAFQLRKTTAKAKLNTTVPLEWKDKFDNLAFQLKVGKYELLTYMVGVCLGV